MWRLDCGFLEHIVDCWTHHRAVKNSCDLVQRERRMADLQQKLEQAVKDAKIPQAVVFAASKDGVYPYDDTVSRP